MLHKNALPVSYVKQYKILESNRRLLKSMIPYTANCSANMLEEYCMQKNNPDVRSASTFQTQLEL